MIDLFLNLKPFGKQRPRLTNGKVYTPKETKAAERDIVLLVNNYMTLNGIGITDKPLSVQIIFYFPDPTIKTDEPFCPEMCRLYTKKPDVDNAAKTVLDALNNLVYFDDSQVCKLVCEKYYASQYGIYLKILEI